MSESILGSFFLQVSLLLICGETQYQKAEPDMKEFFFYFISEKKNTAVGLSVIRSKDASSVPRYAVTWTICSVVSSS